MERDFLLEGVGTQEEMEAHVISELKRRGCLTTEFIEQLTYEEIPPHDSIGRYRVRIPVLKAGTEKL